MEHLLAQQRELPVAQRGGIAAAVRQWREALPGAILLEKAGHRPTANFEDVCHLIKCAFAALVGENYSLAGVS